MPFTNSQRFRLFFSRDPAIDRTPVVEGASWWDQTLTRWRGKDSRPQTTGETASTIIGGRTCSTSSGAPPEERDCRRPPPTVRR